MLNHPPLVYTITYSSVSLTDSSSLKATRKWRHLYAPLVAWVKLQHTVLIQVGSISNVPKTKIEIVICTVCLRTSITLELTDGITAITSMKNGYGTLLNVHMAQRNTQPKYKLSKFRYPNVKKIRTCILLTQSVRMPRRYPQRVPALVSKNAPTPSAVGSSTPWWSGLDVISIFCTAHHVTRYPVLNPRYANGLRTCSTDATGACIRYTVPQLSMWWNWSPAQGATWHAGMNVVQHCTMMHHMGDGLCQKGHVQQESTA